MTRGEGVSIKILGCDTFDSRSAVLYPCTDLHQVPAAALACMHSVSRREAHLTCDRTVLLPGQFVLCTLSVAVPLLLFAAQVFWGNKYSMYCP